MSNLNSRISFFIIICSLLGFPLSAQEIPLTSDNYDHKLPQWSPNGNWIVYQKYDATSDQIYKVLSAGGTEIALTSDSYMHEDPQWSTDGNWIVYDKYDQANMQIYKVSSSGGAEIALTSDTFWHEYPQWSPNGNWIVYNKNATGYNQIYKMPSAGGSEIALTGDSYDHGYAQWSPDGNWIVYQKCNATSDCQIYKVPSAGGSEIALTSDSYNHALPQWSPDGNWIVYSKSEASGYEQIYKVPSAGGTEIALTSDSYNHALPQWSPDGNWIVYSKDDATGYFQIYKIPAQKSWTILIFMNGDNNLEPGAIYDINELERAVDTTLYNVLVEVDRHPGYDPSNGNWTSTRDYYITYDPSGDNTIRSYMLYENGELNMGDGNTFSNFVSWGASLFPANHYLVIIWDHGSGWYKGNNQLDPIIYGISHDETDNDEIKVSDQEYRNALYSISDSLGRPIDILAHDACLMAMQEVSYEAKEYANVIVSSEETVPGLGYPYTDILNWLNSNPNATPQSLSVAIVNAFIQSYQPGGSQYLGQSATLSSINPGSSYLTLSQKIDRLAYHLINAGGPLQSDIYSARLYSQHYQSDYRDHIDLYDFAQRINNTSSLPPILRAAADTVMAYIGNILFAEGHYSGPIDSSVDGSHGLAIYYPLDPGSVNIDYLDLIYTNEYPSWYEFITNQNNVQEPKTPLYLKQLGINISPNPSHDNINVNIQLPLAMKISLKAYDSSGRLIKTLLDKNETSGPHNYLWNCKGSKGYDIPNGIYFLKLTSDDNTITQKFIYIK